MVVNVDFMSQKTVCGALTPRPGISAVRLSGNEMRRHEQVMEYRAKVNSLDANLKSALAALESANTDIARLNDELAELRTQGSGFDPKPLRAEIDHLNAENAQLKEHLKAAEEKLKSVLSAKNYRKWRSERKTDCSDPASSGTGLAN